MNLIIPLIFIMLRLTGVKEVYVASDDMSTAGWRKTFLACKLRFFNVQ